MNPLSHCPICKKSRAHANHAKCSKIMQAEYIKNKQKETKGVAKKIKHR